MDFLKAYCSFLRLYIILVAFQCNADVANQTSTLIVDASQSGRAIPSTLFGVFFEEINHAGAGGLWAELVSNRGFELWDSQDPSNIANWTRVGEESSVKVETELSSCFERNKVAVRIGVLCDNCSRSGVGIANHGYWGMSYPDNASYMFNNAHVFDKMPRKGPKAFVSEYVLGKEPARHETLLGGVSEAGFLIGLEEKSDVVAMASYAPLFVYVHDRKESNGATFLNSTLEGVDSQNFAASAIRLQNPQNNKTYLKIKVANLGSAPMNLKISLKGVVSSNLTELTKTILTSGNPMDENSFANPKKIIPQQSKLENPSNEMNVTIPPVSFTVFDLV